MEPGVSHIPNPFRKKHITLTILQKIDIIQKLDNGESVRNLCDQFGVGISTIYDIKKHKEKILNFFLESDSDKAMVRRTMKTTKPNELDELLFQWFTEEKAKGIIITDQNIIDRGKQIHRSCGIAQPCQFSPSWLYKFKLRHGIRLTKDIGNQVVKNEEEPPNGDVDKEIVMNVEVNRSQPSVYTGVDPALGTFELKEGIEIADRFIRFMEKHSFITKHEIKYVRKIRKKLVAVKNDCLERTNETDERRPTIKREEPEIILGYDYDDLGAT